MKTIRNILLAVFVVLLIGGYFMYAFLDEAYYERRDVSGAGVFVIKEGEDVRSIAERLEEEGYIDSSLVFLWGVWSNGTYSEIRSGNYGLTRSLSSYEVVQILTKKEPAIKQIKVTFPEGWTIQRMSEELSESGLAGEDFLVLAMNPTSELRKLYDFLDKLPAQASLEGYLFPDTYFFSENSQAEFIVQKMLDAFDAKVMQVYGEDISSHQRSLHEIVTMASIIETEVRTQDDRALVSGIFWKRLADDFPLQSDATLEYVLQTNALQHTADDLQVDSLYNSYKYIGLPPGPVAQPSSMSIRAALDPTESDYYYFLSDPRTGETLFAKDFEEHKRNKVQVGL